MPVQNLSNPTCGLFLFNVLRYEVIVRIADINGIIEHHCLNFKQTISVYIPLSIPIAYLIIALYIYICIICLLICVILLLIMNLSCDVLDRFCISVLLFFLFFFEVNKENVISRRLSILPKLFRNISTLIQILQSTQLLYNGKIIMLKHLFVDGYLAHWSCQSIHCR